MGVLVVCALFALATGAVADTIYLKNGRTIRTSDTRIEGGNVIFMQFGGEVTIPMSEVDRIEEDDLREPEPLSASQPAQRDPAVDPEDPNAPDPAVDPDDPNVPGADDRLRAGDTVVTLVQDSSEQEMLALFSVR